MRGSTWIIFAAVAATTAACSGRAAPASEWSNNPQDDVWSSETQTVLANAIPPDPTGPNDPDQLLDDPSDPTGAACSFETPPQLNNMLLAPSKSCRSALCLYTGMDIARCTDLCREDSDCPSATASCPSGFVCAARFAVGPPACCQLCICRDALRADEQQDLVGCSDQCSVHD